MPLSIEYNSLVPFPRLEKAELLVPKEFHIGYEWFLSNENKVIDRLPYGKNTPVDIGFPLARQAGIHSPSERIMTYPGKRYVLSVHSSDLDRYPDKEPIFLDNGTWIIDYSAQDSTVDTTKQDYNGWLLNCLRDGVPVGVMTKRKEGKYTVHGLAYVESYNPISHSFLLHGPVNSTTEANGCFDFADRASFSKTEQETIDTGDQVEQQKLVLRVQRIRQDKFRKSLIDAYGGRCAITGTNVPEVLQAAHIEPYRGSRSQKVENGILLRADIHLLYDSRLISITPCSHKVTLHPRLKRSDYSHLSQKQIAVPADPRLKPNDLYLANQYKLFQIESIPAS